jgi:hypothetical protein
MASLKHAKLANSLIWQASHSSLGSANDFRHLVEHLQSNEGGCLFFVYYSIRNFFRRASRTLGFEKSAGCRQVLRQKQTGERLA